VGDRGFCPSCEADGHLVHLLPAAEAPGVSWCIYGGESGPGFRPEGTSADPKAWARDMRDLCRAQGVAFFHKQSAHRFNERGRELDGVLVEELPVSRHQPEERES
jgi:protein gp37